MCTEKTAEKHDGRRKRMFMDFKAVEHQQESLRLVGPTY